MPQTERTSERTTLSAQRATQGESTGHVRLMLHASLALALIAGIVLYAIYFL